MTSSIPDRGVPLHDVTYFSYVGKRMDMSRSCKPSVGAVLKNPAPSADRGFFFD